MLPLPGGQGSIPGLRTRSHKMLDPAKKRREEYITQQQADGRDAQGKAREVPSTGPGIPMEFRSHPGLSLCSCLPAWKLSGAPAFQGFYFLETSWFKHQWLNYQPLVVWPPVSSSSPWRSKGRDESSSPLIVVGSTNNQPHPSVT